jgi:hypothetical protein
MRQITGMRWRWFLIAILLSISILCILAHAGFEPVAALFPSSFTAHRFTSGGRDGGGEISTAGITAIISFLASIYVMSTMGRKN